MIHFVFAASFTFTVTKSQYSIRITSRFLFAKRNDEVQINIFSHLHTHTQTGRIVMSPAAGIYRWPIRFRTTLLDMHSHVATIINQMLICPISVPGEVKILPIFSIDRTLLLICDSRSAPVSVNHEDGCIFLYRTHFSHTGRTAMRNDKMMDPTWCSAPR